MTHDFATVMEKAKKMCESSMKCKDCPIGTGNTPCLFPILDGEPDFEELARRVMEWTPEAEGK